MRERTAGPCPRIHPLARPEARRGLHRGLSARWEWVERARAYDDHVERQARVEQERERRDMARRNAKIAVLGQNVVVKGIEKLLADIGQGNRNPTPSDLGPLLDVAVRVERLARGEPTEISELGGSDEHPVRLSIEERARHAIEPDHQPQPAIAVAGFQYCGQWRPAQATATPDDH